MDFLKSAVASAISKGPLGAYSVGDRVDVDNTIWTVNNATKRDSGARCSILTFDKSANKSRLPIAQNAVRKSRTLQHPGVVKTLDTIETDSHIYIITESLSPLSWLTRRKAITEETAKWGLWTVAKTIKFINEDASSVHACIRASSVFLGESGEWKLGAFDLLSSMNDENAVIYTFSSLVPDMGRYLPPEVSKTGWDTIKRNPLSATDAYGFGVLVTEVFNGAFSGADTNTQAKAVPPSMQQSYKRLMNPNPKARMSVSNFLDQGLRYGGFFRTPLINLSEGVDTLGLKSDDEKAQFLDQLGEVGDDFPEEYMKKKVLPELLKTVEFGGGGPTVFNVVLKIGTKMSEEEYEVQLTPTLIRLFASTDRAMRMCLLENLPLMIDRLSNKIVSDKIFANMATGFTDTAPVIREQTVKSILVVIEKLSDRIINGELLRFLAKTANDPEPGIRTNTTICLGKIAKYLGKNSRSKILVAAFTRSLRDPFVHARNAGVLALAATSDMFTEDDCATKVLPALCPSLLDKEKMVRDAANKALESYLARVRSHASTLPATAAPAAGEPGSTTPQPRMSAPQASADAASSWAGWAISSFTANKNTSGTLNPTAPPPTSSLANGRTHSSPVVVQTTQPRPLTLADRSSASIQTSRSATPTAEDSSATAEAIAEDFDADAWGEMDDMDEEAEPASELEPVPTSAPKPAPAPPKAAAFNDSAEPDFAAWLAAKKQPAARKDLPKGLGKKTGSISKPAPSRTASNAKVVKAEESTTADEEGWGDAWD